MMYYPHNIHFLWAALSMEGRSQEAIAAASRLAKKLTPEMALEMPMVEYFLPVRLYALVRFQKWNEVLKEKAFPHELTFAGGMWHYARGKALAAQGQTAEAAAELTALKRALAATPQDATVMRHSSVRLLGIAENDLSATLAAAAGQLDEAIAALRLAVLLQDQLLYDEPPPWYFPEREALGRVLLKADRAEEAEAVFREDLERNPHSAWALFGLEKSLRARPSGRGQQGPAAIPAGLGPGRYRPAVAEPRLRVWRRGTSGRFDQCRLRLRATRRNRHRLLDGQQRQGLNHDLRLNVKKRGHQPHAAAAQLSHATQCRGADVDTLEFANQLLDPPLFGSLGPPQRRGRTAPRGRLLVRAATELAPFGNRHRAGSCKIIHRSISNLTYSA